MSIKKIAKRLALLAYLAPAAALAIVQPVMPVNTVVSVETLFDKVCAVVYWIFGAMIILAVIFVLVAAFRYLTAGGDPEKVGKANHSLVYAAVAVVVALLARAVPTIVATFMGASTTFTGC